MYLITYDKLCHTGKYLQLYLLFIYLNSTDIP